jgi:hypothetical protein
MSNGVTTGGTTRTGASALPAAGGTSSSTLSEWAGPYVTDMLGKSQAIAAQPYQTYQGPLTAGTSTLQNKYFGGLGALTFPSQLGQSFTSGTAPTLPTASTTGTTAGAAQPTGIASQYMNPYLNAVLQPQLTELNRQAQIKQMENAARMSKAGAFGGGRQAIMDAELQRNLLSEANKAIGTGYANAYDKAMGQFNTEVGQAKTLADMMSEAGAKQRAIEQEGITADLNEFLTQRDYPKTQVQFLQSMLQGLPISTVTNTPAQQSGIGQLSSTVGGLGSLIESLKKLGVNLGG